ncbi:putative dash complex subunit dad1 [Rosellinia necatrix]|uniref:DASH complex subunit DAD1 n=1 Tax=Rosellinia necatrix TaxID=77044 RepID=A0A1S7UKU0_ROSNE|nr:putative dash complex subunit dad1 [Rosellinia necatrix]
MATHSRSTSIVSRSMGAGDSGGAREKTRFEQQREALIGEIAMSFEHVLANINKLNRSLEAVVAVGNEFSSVEALWSQFENVMAKDEDEGKAAGGDEQEHPEGGERYTTPKDEPA